MQKQILIVGLCILILQPFGAEGKDPCHFSTEGTDFWLGLMQNRSKFTDHYLEITVTSRKGADFTVTYGSAGLPVGQGNYTVTANNSESVIIDYTILEASGSETVEEKGIHIQATDSVNVYAINFRQQSSDVAVIYPTESLGKEYFAMCYTPNPTNTNESNSEFLIVATADHTTVQITPTVDCDQGFRAGQTYTIPLEQGQSYQVQSMNSVVSGQGDLTGTYILADQPIAFYSGVKSTSVPFSTATNNSRDHLYEQIPPTNTWGRDFYLVPLAQRAKDTYRVLAAEEGTVVTIEGHKTETLGRGEFYEFELNSNEACRLISSKKVLLAQYCRSQNVDGNGGVGDPFMIILSPISQKINDVTFVAYESALIRDMFYMNLITLTSEVGNIQYDEAPIDSKFFKTFPNGKYAYAQIPISSGPHRLFNPNKDGGFLAYVYGYGERTESYGYGVGFNLDIQLEIGGSFDPDLDTLKICYGESAKLEAGEYFKSYLWSTGETTFEIMTNNPGWYWVTAITAPVDSTVAGCEKTDSLYVQVLKPNIFLGNDTSVCLPGELMIVAEKGFKSYRWQDGSEGRSYVVDSTGNYSVIATTEFGCQATDEIHVEVIMPRLAFEPDYPVVTIEHPEITFTNLTQGALTYHWDFGDGKSSTDIKPTHRFPAIGNYTVVLTAVSEFNCTDTKEMNVEVIPFKFFIPNAFKPNSDIAENRLFKPLLNAVDPNNYQFRIFNRIGSTIFETRDPDTGWTGTNSEPGVYVWTVQYLDIQGYEHTQKGTVMLLR